MTSPDESLARVCEQDETESSLTNNKGECMNLKELEKSIAKINGGCIYPTDYIYKKGLREGEIWLTTEPEKMTWYEAVEMAASRSNIRLPNYSDLINAAQHAEEGFHPLEEGEFWAVESENYKPNEPYSCCLARNHKQYESHHLKSEKKWVRFIKVGDPAQDLEKTFAKRLMRNSK